MALSPQDFESLIRSAPGPRVVFDRGHTIVTANDAFLAVAGRDRDEVVGRNAFEVFPENPEAAEGPRSFRASLGRVFETGRADRLPTLRYDLPGAGGEGFVERYWEPVNYPVVDDSGHVTHVIHEVEDVTEAVRLRRTEAETTSRLAEARSVYEAIYDQGLFAGRLDLEGTVLDANRSSLEQCGFSREDVIGRPFWDCGWWNRSPEVQAWVRGAVERARGGEAFRGVSTYFVADGSERIVEFACMPIKDEAGKVLFLLPTGIDITERVRAEREQRATAILESITDAFFSLDRQWRFTYFNPQAEPQLKRKRGELVGKVIWEEFPAALGTNFEREYRAAMDERRPVTFEEYYPEPLDRWYEVNAYPTEEGLAVYFRNVTERRRAEGALDDARRTAEQQARYFDATLSAVRDLVFAFDRDLRIRYANRALLELWQVPADDAIGKTMEELGYPEETREQVASHLRTVIETGRPVSAEVWYRNPAGTIGYYDYTLSPEYDDAGAIVRVVGSARDTTERRATEAERERLFKEVQAERETLSTVFRLAPSFLAVLRGPDHVFELVNQNYARLIGHREVVTKPIREALPEIEGQGFIELLDRVYASGEPYVGGDVRVLLRREPEQPLEERFVDFVYQPLREPDGRTSGILVHGVDLTDRKRAEERLRQSEERYRALFTSIDEAFCIIELIFDSEGSPVDYRFMEVNRAFEHHTGLKNATGRTIRELAPDIDAHWFGIYGRVAVTGEATRFAQPSEALDRWFDVYAFRLGEPEQRKVAILFTDISERRRRSEQLKALASVATRLNASHDTASVLQIVAHEVRALVGAHQSVTSLTDNDDWAQSINTVSLSEKYERWKGDGSPPDGTGIYALVCRENRPMRLTQAELEAHPAWRGIGTHRGEHPPMNGWLAVPLIGRDGKNLGLIQLSDKYAGEFDADDEAILVQLAHLTSVAIANARLYEQLRDNDRKKDEFLAMLAHELRNPLSAIHSAVRVAQSPKMAEHLPQTLEIIERQGRNLARLIDDLLDVSRITRGKVELKPEVVDLSGAITRAIQAVRPFVDQKRHELSIGLSDGFMRVDADPTRLEQIIGNLLTNAAKYTEPGGRITISAEKNGEQAVITVRDNGVGISAEMLPRVFDMFTQADRSLARSEGGLGIGLALVKRLVELHGGSIAATSEPGRGSEFVVRLPIAHAARENVKPADRVEVPGAGKKVLIVDDNADTAQLIQRLLRSQGYEVRLCHDGREAIDEARSFGPEAVLLDIGLPGMDGYEVARELRRDPRCRETTIIAVSGYGDPLSREQGRQAGFDHHLVKPVDVEAVTQILSGPGESRGQVTCPDA